MYIMHSIINLEDKYWKHKSYAFIQFIIKKFLKQDNFIS